LNDGDPKKNNDCKNVKNCDAATGTNPKDSTVSINNTPGTKDTDQTSDKSTVDRGSTLRRSEKPNETLTIADDNDGTSVNNGTDRLSGTTSVDDVCSTSVGKRTKDDIDDICSNNDINSSNSIDNSIDSKHNTASGATNVKCTDNVSNVNTKGMDKENCTTMESDITQQDGECSEFGEHEALIEENQTTVKNDKEGPSSTKNKCSSDRDIAEDEKFSLTDTHKTCNTNGLQQTPTIPKENTLNSAPYACTTGSKDTKRHSTTSMTSNTESPCCSCCRGNKESNLWRILRHASDVMAAILVDNVFLISFFCLWYQHGRHENVFTLALITRRPS
jgi:hypothetical protein